MTTFFINRFKMGENFFDETICFYVQYMIAEQFDMYCNLAYLADYWHNRKNWNDEMVIKMDRLFNPEQKASEEEIEESRQIIKKLKTFKNKDKKMLGMIAHYNNYVKAARQVVYEDMENLFRGSYFWEWIDLLDGETAYSMPFKLIEYIELMEEEDELIEVLTETITESPEDFLFVNSYVTEYFKPIVINPDTENTEVCDKHYFYSLPLFTFPFGLSLEKDNMKVIRKGMQTKMTNISNMLGEFKSMIRNEPFVYGVREQCRQLLQKLQPDVQAMQKHIDEELYFQQTINKLPQVLMLEIRVGVAPIETIVDYYEAGRTLMPYVAEATKKRLSLLTDLNKCDVFLYWNAEAQLPD